MSRIYRILVLIFVILCAAVINASAQDKYFYDDFNNGISSAWLQVPKSGTIESVGADDKFVRVTIPSSGDSDAIIQTNRLYNCAESFTLKLSMKMTTDNGTVNLFFRDNSSSGNFVFPVKISAGKIYYFPELNKAAVFESLPTNKIAYIELVVDHDSDTISVYRNNELKYTLNNVKKTYSNFNWQSMLIRMQSVRGGNNKCVAEYDNFYLAFDSANLSISADARIVESQLNYDYDNVSAEFLCDRNPKTDITAILAHYRAGNLVGMSMSEITNREYYKVKKVLIVYPRSEIQEGDVIKLMAYNNLDNIKPLAREVTYIVKKPEYNQVSVPTKNDIALLLNRSHPRVITNEAKFTSLKNMIAKYPSANQSKWWSARKWRPDGFCDVELPSYEDDDPLRLVASGQVYEHVRYLALAYKLTSNEKYAEKIWEHMVNCGNWKDWGENHFLNTAEIMMSYAIAYDWLYDYWTPSQREYIGDTLMNKGLKVAKEHYDNRAIWTESDSNWAAVCNGGVAVAATALMGEYDGCEELLIKSLTKIQQCYPHFKPNGSWYEGVDYWEYTMKFWSLTMSTMETAYGTDFGHGLAEGIKETTMYPLYMTGTNNIFNFGDSTEHTVNCSPLLYLGAKYGNKLACGYRVYQINSLGIGADVTDIIWYDTTKTTTNLTGTESDIYYSNIESVIMRKGFANATKSAVMLHGGENNISHSQLDAGQFFYETDGIRWAIDLGAENYNLYRIDRYTYEDDPAGLKNKSSYYRMRAEGHNTWVINPKYASDQVITGEGKITGYNFDDDISWAIVDLSSAYSDEANSVKRGIKLDKRNGAAIIRDELDLKKENSELYWFMHTRADITLSSDKKSAILTAKNDEGVTKRIWVGITDGSGIFSVMNASRLPTTPNPDLWAENATNLGTELSPKVQNPNTGVRKLAIHYTGVSGTKKQSVYMIPLADGESAPSKTYSGGDLSQW